MKRLYVTVLLLVASAILLAACGGSNYWDGGPYSDRPVYGTGEEQGISRRLHDDAKKCNISDETIKNVMANVMTAGSNGLQVTDVTAIYDMGGGGGADVVMTVLEDGIWELKLTCK